MPNTLEEKDWDLLLRRIEDGKCTPFLGAGACFGALPLGSEIAREWAQKYHYPLEDSSNLVRVAQFLAVERDPMYPKEEILKQFERKLKKDGPPNFREPDEPHGVLADLPLPVYMTTNYDDFMVQALKSRYRDPKREMCRWNALVKDYSSIFDSRPDFTPTPANPVVFHLHGHNEVPESLVLTEDDYLGFLTSISRQQELLPLPIERALYANSLLFIGYSLADWNFRVLIQGLARTLKRLYVAVLLPPSGPEAERRKVQAYLERYYEQIAQAEFQVYWGTAREFSAELRQRWEMFSAHH